MNSGNNLRTSQKVAYWIKAFGFALITGLTYGYLSTEWWQYVVTVIIAFCVFANTFMYWFKTEKEKQSIRNGVYALVHGIIAGGVVCLAVKEFFPDLWNETDYGVKIGFTLIILFAWAETVHERLDWLTIRYNFVDLDEERIKELVREVMRRY